jgi:hypothetical protein
LAGERRQAAADGVGNASLQVIEEFQCKRLRAWQ